MTIFSKRFDHEMGVLIYDVPAFSVRKQDTDCLVLTLLEDSFDLRRGSHLLLSSEISLQREISW